MVLRASKTAGSSGFEKKIHEPVITVVTPRQHLANIQSIEASGVGLEDSGARTGSSYGPKLTARHGTKRSWPAKLTVIII